MMEVRRTEAFACWIDSIRDATIKGRILIRLDRLQLGLLGDYKSIGQGVCEIRMNFGPGYRIYFSFRGQQIVLLLTGGDKGSQSTDIRKAKLLLKTVIGGLS